MGPFPPLFSGQRLFIFFVGNEVTRPGVRPNNNMSNQLLDFFQDSSDKFRAKKLTASIQPPAMGRTFMEGGERAQPTNHKGGQRMGGERGRQGGRQAGFGLVQPRAEA